MADARAVSIAYAAGGRTVSKQQQECVGGARDRERERDG